MIDRAGAIMPTTQDDPGPEHLAEFSTTEFHVMRTALQTILGDKPATIETEDGDLLYLWHVDEDGQVDHWVIAATAGRAVELAWENIDLGDPGEVNELRCRRVSEREAFWIRYHDEISETKTMLEQLAAEPRAENYFACSEF